MTAITQDLSFLVQESSLSRTVQFVAEQLIANGDVCRVANIEAELIQPTTDTIDRHLLSEDIDTAL